MQKHRSNPSDARPVGIGGFWWPGLLMGHKRSGKRGVKVALVGLATIMLVTGCGAADMDKSSSNTAANSKQESPQADNNRPAEASSEGKPSAKDAGPGFNGNGQTAAEDPFSRKIIYKANLNMQVESYKDTEALVQEAVRKAGGYVLQFSENTSAKEKYGSFVIKVPAAGFNSLLTEFSKINPTMRKSMEGQDVTEEYVDLTSRLKAKELMESRLTAFMEKATKTEELVSFSTELGKVQEEIERIKGRMRYLEQHVSFSTIELYIIQKMASAEVIGASDRGPLFKRAAQALDGSMAALGWLFQGIVVVAAGALPVLVVVVLVGLPIWWVRRKRKAGQAELRRQQVEANRLLEASRRQEEPAPKLADNEDRGQQGPLTTEPKTVQTTEQKPDRME
ncbi:DUF4349 domain-containing protein [Paenibacillus filicis]|uniref:DUF4349 domain-containing protein n=1 Tax=Paenibacillus filicis TaxID=669464 RepID=A0ABU9DLH8_9BACL